MRPSPLTNTGEDKIESKCSKRLSENGPNDRDQEWADVRSDFVIFYAFSSDMKPNGWMPAKTVSEISNHGLGEIS